MTTLQWFLIGFKNFKNEKFQWIWIKYDRSIYGIINSTSCINLISDAATKATKQIFINCLNISEQDFQTIVKASCNVEKVILNWCCIHCSSPLDFDKKLIYKTKFINFQSWGSKETKFITTDWKKDKNWFKNILEAIWKSKLKDSLQKIGIYNNPNLSINTIQEVLNNENANSIKIVQEWSNPTNEES